MILVEVGKWLLILGICGLVLAYRLDRKAAERREEERRRAGEETAGTPAAVGSPRCSSAWWPSSGWGKLVMVLWLLVAVSVGIAVPMLRDMGPRPLRMGPLVGVGAAYLLTVLVRWLMLSRARGASSAHPR